MVKLYTEIEKNLQRNYEIGKLNIIVSVQFPLLDGAAKLIMIMVGTLHDVMKQ